MVTSLFFFGRKPFFFAINYNCRKVCYVVISWPQIQLLFEKLAKRIKFFRITSMQKPITTNSLYSPLQKLILYFVRKRVMIIHRKLLQFCNFFLPKVLWEGGKLSMSSKVNFFLLIFFSKLNIFVFSRRRMNIFY